MSQNAGKIAGEAVAIAGLSTGVLHALAALLGHFADHTVAFKVGKVIQQVADATDVAAAIAVPVIAATGASSAAEPAPALAGTQFQAP